MKFGKNILQAFRNIRNTQRGITGLETAIVLIAFVVVSSVFAFAALSTGMFSSDKARETILAGLAQTRATMEIKGSVIGTVQLVGNDDVGENRAWHKLEFLVLHVEDRCARDVGGQ